MVCKKLQLKCYLKLKLDNVEEVAENVGSEQNVGTAT